MKVIKYNYLSERQIEDFADIMFDGFSKNDFIYNYLSGGKEKCLRRYMRMIVEYNNKFADFYELVEEDGTLCAAAIYLPEDCKPLGILTAINRKKFLILLKVLLLQSIKYTKRILRFSELETRLWYKEPSVILDVVVSRVKGCGKRLLEES